MFTLDSIDIGDPSDSSVTIVLSWRGTYIYRLKRGGKKADCVLFTVAGSVYVRKYWFTCAKAMVN